MSQHAPLICTTIERLLVAEEVLRLLGRVDAVAGSAMQIDADVYFILPAPFYGTVNILQHLLVHLIILARTAPVPVAQGQPHKVEAPVVNPLELLLAEGFGISGSKIVQQVEAAPALGVSLAATAGHSVG